MTYLLYNRDIKATVWLGLDVKKVSTVTPKNADNKKLTYSIDKKYSKYASIKSAVVTVKNGVVTAKKGKKGKVTITIKSTDGTNKGVKVKVTVKK